MSPVVDCAVLFLLLYFLLDGLHRGFAHILIGPLSLGIGVLASLFYFRQTHNIIHCFLIMIAGPVLTAILLSLLLSLWHKKVNRVEGVPFLSRLAGGIFNLGWGILLASLFLTFIAIMPPEVLPVQGLQKGVVDSYAYKLVNLFIKDKIPYVNNVEILLQETRNPQKMAAIQVTPEFKTFYSDEKIQEVLSDEETVREIRTKDFTKLMTNPKIQALFQDEALLKKILDLNTQMGNQAPQNNLPPSEPQKPE